MVPGVPCADRGNCARECDNAVLLEDRFSKTDALYAHLTQMHTRRIQGNELTDKQVEFALPCNEGCRILNLNPVVVAKHTRKELKHSSLKC